MYSAKYVDEKLAEWKQSGNPLAWIAWQVALLCVAWAYVFGDRGQYCTPANRRAAYNRTAEGKNKDNIKAKCKNFEGTGSCSGCKWFPDGLRTRDFDCRGFTYWILKVVYGWELKGAGCTSQWNTEANWKAKGEISDGIPQGVPVCVFYYKKDSKGNRTKTLEHTGLYYNGETVECSNGVQHSTTLNKKWEVWGVPACVGGDIPTPTPTPTPTPSKPTLKRGSKGEYVTLAQTELIQKGYDCGSFGADGQFGAATEKAVRAFQQSHGLTVDGIIGQKTWAALDAVEPVVKYMVTIPHLSKSQADALCSQYPGATMTEERG